MQFDKSKVILFHGVVDLRKSAAGLVALVDDPQPGTWYFFSNRTRRLMKCVRLDRSGVWMDPTLEARALPAGSSAVGALQF